MDVAVHIQGSWTLIMIIPVNLMTKLYFKHGNGTRGLVFYDASKVAQCKREKLYNLVGWQKMQSRHNLYFDKNYHNHVLSFI